MGKIISINVSSEYTLENHNVNASEDGRNKEANGKVYISGQKIRHMLFEKMKDFIYDDGEQHLISTGDSITGDIKNDIRSDIGGYMLTSDKNGKNEKRKSPLNVAFAVSKNESNYFNDLFVRFKNNETKKGEKNDQRINNKTYSLKDVIDINYQLNIDEVGRKKEYVIVDNQFVKEQNTMCISEEEKLYRLELFLKSIGELKGLANTSRNATNNTPDKIFINFSNSRKFIKYFELSNIEKKNILNNEDIHFIGDNSVENGDSVEDAIEKAIEYLKDNINNISL